jgi:3-oxoadipate enol-lactonase
MFYLTDDFTDPWSKAETVLLLHGNAESSKVWFGWVPHLARQFRVVRPDMRGFGASTPMPRDYPWSLDSVVDDYLSLMQTLGIEHFHLVGAKISGTVARRLAARCPEQVLTLTLVGAPPPLHKVPAHVPDLVAELEKKGLQPWARRTMASRLGTRFPEAGVDWWVNMMAETAVSTQAGFLSSIDTWDVSADLPRIKCPTLVITTEGSAHGSVESTRAWQQDIQGSKLIALPGDSFHVAASDAERCAKETSDFIAHAGAVSR